MKKIVSRGKATNIRFGIKFDLNLFLNFKYGWMAEVIWIINLSIENRNLFSGPVMVSMIGNAGWTESLIKEPK